jgi:hypothetical protein
MGHTVIVMDVNGCPITGRRSVTYPHLLLKVYRSPAEYKRDKATAGEWSFLGQQVREMNKSLCQGGIASGFFSSEKHIDETSLVFLLYGVPSKGRENLYAFALCNDLTHERHRDEREDNESSIYLDAICANPRQIREDRRVAMKVSAGKILINAIENYARKHRVEMVRLSALPYVVHYYRKLGYRHIHGGRTAADEDKELTRLADATSMMRFTDSDALENAYKVEMALAFGMLGSEEERRAADMRNLNAYFPSYRFFPDERDRSRMRALPRDYSLGDLDGTQHGDREIMRDIVALERMVNEKLSERGGARSGESGMKLKDFFAELVRQRFALDCEDDGRTGRLMIELGDWDEAGKTAELACDQNGYTMRKNIKKEPHLIKCTGARKGGASRKNVSRVYRRMARTRRHGHKTRKAVPWAGWGKLAPQGKERTRMLRDCGKKCFLGPKRSFPICAKGTCKVSKKGVAAAYVRARQWGKKASSYKGKARPTHRRSVYTRVAKKARKMMKGGACACGV